MSLFIDWGTAVKFDSFGTEYFPQKALNKTRDKSVSHNILEYKMMILLCVDFFYCVCRICACREKTLLDYTIAFSANDYKNKDKIMHKYFKDKYSRRSKSWVYIRKNLWNKKLSFRWNKT